MNTASSGLIGRMVADQETISSTAVMDTLCRDSGNHRSLILRRFTQLVIASLLEGSQSRGPGAALAP